MNSQLLLSPIINMPSEHVAIWPAWFLPSGTGGIRPISWWRIGRWICHIECSLRERLITVSRWERTSHCLLDCLHRLRRAGTTPLERSCTPTPTRGGRSGQRSNKRMWYELKKNRVMEQTEDVHSGGVCGKINPRLKMTNTAEQTIDSWSHRMTHLLDSYIPTICNEFN